MFTELRDIPDTPILGVILYDVYCPLCTRNARRYERILKRHGFMLEAAQSPAIEKRVRKTTAEFHAMQVSQRPTFVVDTEIGDRAVFSGVVKLEPIAATIDSMIEDAIGYAAHKAHFGDPPLK